MTIRWPLMIAVPGPLKPRWLVPDDWRWKMVRRDGDLDEVWLAPWWLAWLYRVLPCHVGWCAGPEYGAGWFLWNIAAPTWLLGWLPAARSLYGAQRVPVKAWWNHGDGHPVMEHQPPGRGVLVVGIGERTWHLFEEGE